MKQTQTGKVARKLSLDHWQAVIDTNLTGTFLCMRDAAEAITNGGWPGLHRRAGPAR